MAFNPFHAFRKNSKPLMAALTIFVMFVFVLSTGGGGKDFFDWIARQLGADDQRGQVLGSIDGKDYRQHDLQEIRRKRMAANSFIVQAVVTADQKILGQIGQELDSGAVKNPLLNNVFRETLRTRNAMRDPRGDRMQALRARFDYQQLAVAVNQLVSTPNPNENKADAAMLRKIARVINNDFRLMEGGNNYFNAIPNGTEQDALQFAEYSFLADKMKVKFSDSDIQKLIAEETDGQLSEKDASTIIQRVTNDYRGLSSDQIFKAIGDEFRVMATFKILTGDAVFSGRRAIPAGMTPYEFFQYWKDQCAEHEYEIVDVAVDKFIDQVKDIPTDAELRSFFDKYKKDEFDPSKERPGFKEPRKVRLEYIIIDPLAPVYKNSQPVLQAASVIAGGLNPTLFGGGAVPAVVAISDPLMAESWNIKDKLQSKVNRSKFRLDLFERNWSGNLGIGLKLADSSYYQPLPGIWERPATWLRPAKLQTSKELTAASVAALLAPTNYPYGVMEEALAVAGLRAELIETVDRAKVGVQLLLAPTKPEFPFTTAAALFANAPAEPVPVYEAQAREEVVTEYPKAMARYDVAALQKKLNDLRVKIREDEKKDLFAKKKEPAKLDPKKVDDANDEARKYLNEWIKDHPGVKTGLGSGLFDKFRIGEDPALQVVLEPLKSQPNFSQVVESLWFGNPGPGKDAARATLFDPDVLSDQSTNQTGRDYTKPIHIAWKIEDVEAKIYDRFDNISPEMRAEVIRAWKFEKARGLAKTAAEEFAVKARDLAKKELIEAKNEDAFVKGLKELYRKDNYTSVPPVTIAMLKKTGALPAGHIDSSVRYEGPNINNKQLVFPPDNLASQLLEVRNKPLGETLVIPNVPKSHYYVATMIRSQELKIENFYTDVYVNTSVPDTRRREADSLYRNHAFREVVLPEFGTDLRNRLKAETKYKETDEMKKTLEKPANNPDL